MRRGCEMRRGDAHRPRCARVISFRVACLVSCLSYLHLDYGSTEVGIVSTSGHYFDPTQSSKRIPGTLMKWRVLCVTTIKSRLME